MAVAHFDTLRSLAFGSISGDYAALGSALSTNARVFKLTNGTDGDLFVSLDGVNNQIFLPAGSFTLYDLSTNSPPIAVTDNLVLAIGTQFSVKQSTAPTSGSVYLEIISSNI
jgi:hypothetical protein